MLTDVLAAVSVWGRQQRCSVELRIDETGGSAKQAEQSEPECDNRALD